VGLRREPARRRLVRPTRRKGGDRRNRDSDRGKDRPLDPRARQPGPAPVPCARHEQSGPRGQAAGEGGAGRTACRDGERRRHLLGQREPRIEEPRDGVR